MRGIVRAGWYRSVSARNTSKRMAAIRLSYDLSGKTVRRQNSDAKNTRFEYDASIRLADSNLIG